LSNGRRLPVEDPSPPPMLPPRVAVLGTPPTITSPAVVVMEVAGAFVVEAAAAAMVAVAMAAVAATSCKVSFASSVARRDTRWCAASSVLMPPSLVHHKRAHPLQAHRRPMEWTPTGMLILVPQIT
jgi:hypothetical protein